jgi:hypothetical protein
VKIYAVGFDLTGANICHNANSRNLN